MKKTLDEVLKEVRDWQKETFKSPTTTGAFMHLVSEVGELGGALGIPYASTTERLARGFNKEEGVAPRELADIVFLVVQLADCMGIDLSDAVEKTLERNKRRVWKAPDKHGVVEHEREG